MPLQKRNNSHFDFIIVGQGIAGSVMALSLIKAGYTVCVIDKPSMSLSSKVAAGIWNPIVFKRLTKSWLADELVPELFSFYEYWEKEFNTTFIYKRCIVKPFTEEQEKNLWLKKAGEGNRFLDPDIYQHFELDSGYSAPVYSKVLHAGNLNITHFLEHTKHLLTEQQSYIEEEFDHTSLTINPDAIVYKDITAKRIIFCEGHLVHKNPLFKWIPMKPAKGEVITIHSTHLIPENDIFNKGFFIMPLGNNLFKVGATYEWQDLTDQATEKGKEELLKKLNSVITTPYTIVSHEAGVRPSVTDRRPVVGNHPDHKHVFVFNGLGTKAVMLAPYFAKQLAGNIQHKTTIDPEVSPGRFAI